MYVLIGTPNVKSGHDDSTSWVSSEIDPSYTIGTGNVEGFNG